MATNFNARNATQSDTQYCQGSGSGITNSAFTVAFWAKFGNLTQTNAYILEAFTSNQWAVIYNFIAGNKMEFFASGFGGSDPRTGSQIVVPDTNWHHFAYRKTVTSGTTGEWSYFLDGVKTVINASIAFSLPGTGTIVLFNSGTPFSNPFTGALADFVLHNSALTDAQIAQLAAGTVTWRDLLQLAGDNWILSGVGNTECDFGTNACNLSPHGSMTTVAGPFNLGAVTIFGGGEG